jgi:hypothetical protein
MAITSHSLRTVPLLYYQKTGRIGKKEYKNIAENKEERRGRES